MHVGIRNLNALNDTITFLGNLIIVEIGILFEWKCVFGDFNTTLNLLLMVVVESICRCVDDHIYSLSLIHI